VNDSLRYGRIVKGSRTLVLVVVASGLVLSACGTNKSPKASSTTAPAAGSSTTTAPAGSSTTVAPTTTTSIPFSVSQVHTGTGPATLAQFTVPGKAKEWDLDWVYDCKSAPNRTGSFSITVVGHGSAANTTDAGVPAQQGHGTAGLVKNFDTGTFNLKVATPCQWTVRVEVLT